MPDTPIGLPGPYIPRQVELQEWQVPHATSKPPLDEDVGANQVFGDIGEFETAAGLRGFEIPTVATEDGRTVAVTEAARERVFAGDTVGASRLLDEAWRITHPSKQKNAEGSQSVPEGAEPADEAQTQNLRGSQQFPLNSVQINYSEQLPFDKDLGFQSDHTRVSGRKINAERAAKGAGIEHEPIPVITGPENIGEVEAKVRTLEERVKAQESQRDAISDLGPAASRSWLIEAPDWAWNALNLLTLLGAGTAALGAASTSSASTLRPAGNVSGVPVFGPDRPKLKI